jgi:hypothetical protein
VGTQEGKSAGAKLLLISVHQVNVKLSIKPQGPKTVYQQEWNLLRNNKQGAVENPNPREQVILLLVDLITFIKTNQEKDYKITPLPQMQMKT